MKYVYPAIFQKDKEDEDTWCVYFPDVDGAATFGRTLYIAMEMAEDALCGIMVMYEDFLMGRNSFHMKNRIVAPTPIEKIKAEPDEYSTSAFVTLIKADTDKYRRQLAEMQIRENRKLLKKLIENGMICDEPDEHINERTHEQINEKTDKKTDEKTDSKIKEAA